MNPGDVENFLSLFLPLSNLEIQGVDNTTRLRSRNRQNQRSQQPGIPCDMMMDEKYIIVYAQIPGVNKEDILVDIYNTQLTISFEKTKPYENTEMLLSDIVYGNSSRTITLPICITRRDAIAVSFKNGILKIKINKHVEEQNRFSVSVSEEV